MGYRDDTDRTLLALDEHTELEDALARDHQLRTDAARLGLDVDRVVAARVHFQRASHSPETFLRAMVRFLKAR